MSHDPLDRCDDLSADLSSVSHKSIDLKDQIHSLEEEITAEAEIGQAVQGNTGQQQKHAINVSELKKRLSFLKSELMKSDMEKNQILATLKNCQAEVDNETHGKNVQNK